MEISPSISAATLDIGGSAGWDAVADPLQPSFSEALTDATSGERCAFTRWTLLNPPVLSEFDVTPEDRVRQQEREDSSDSDSKLMFLPNPQILPDQPWLSTRASLNALIDVSGQSSESSQSLSHNVLLATPRCFSPQISQTNKDTPASIDSASKQTQGSLADSRLEMNDLKPKDTNARDHHRLAFGVSVVMKDSSPPAEAGAKPAADKNEAPASIPARPANHSLEEETPVNIDGPRNSDSSEAAPIELLPPAVHTPAVAGTEPQRSNTPLASAAAVEPVPEPQIQAAEPVKRMSVDLEGTQGQLRLRVEERAGELRAWISGSTQAGIEKVQAGLADLTQNLATAGFDSEIWTPSMVHASTSASDLQASTEQRDHNHYEGHANNSAEHGGRQRGGSQSEDDSEDEHSFRSQTRKC